MECRQREQTKYSPSKPTKNTDRKQYDRSLYAWATTLLKGKFIPASPALTCTVKKAVYYLLL